MPRHCGFSEGFLSHFGMENGTSSRWEVAFSSHRIASIHDHRGGVKMGEDVGRYKRISKESPTDEATRILWNV